VPRTREGYYHCTAGIEVRFPTVLCLIHGTHMYTHRWLSSELLLSRHTPIWFGWRPRPPTWRKRSPSLGGFERTILESERWSDSHSYSWDLTVLSRWLVYNLSPSFNWGAHGFTGWLTTSFARIQADPRSRTRLEVFRSRACQGRVGSKTKKKPPPGRRQGC